MNPVAGGFAEIERTSVGGDGTFDEGEGTMATGVDGTVLFVGNSL